MRVNDLEHLLKPGFRGAILLHPPTVAQFGAIEWSSRQFMELHLMEPGQWFWGRTAADRAMSRGDGGRHTVGTRNHTPL